MYKYKLHYILASRSLNACRGIRVLAKRSEQGEHELKVVRYVEILGKQISEALR